MTVHLGFNSLEELAESIWNVRRTSADNCVCHNLPQTRETFEDELSWREFRISGLCQSEQNRIFRSEEE
jgi:hypothetical protein